ncbi:hypothetical protein [Escherichia coli]|uniref:hypothetical protein n=1 Tax=Escherichia coli TaxID=562 RepID=UPI003CC90CCC
MNQDGTLDVSGGGHGIDITGDSATVDNKGGMTLPIRFHRYSIDGDKAIVNNDGDNAISNGGTGTQINGDDGQPPEPKSNGIIRTARWMSPRKSLMVRGSGRRQRHCTGGEAPRWLTVPPAPKSRVTL